MRHYILLLALGLSACGASQGEVQSTGFPAPVKQQSSIQSAGTPALLQSSSPISEEGGSRDVVRPIASYGTPKEIVTEAPVYQSQEGYISLNFSDTDIYSVVDQILGNILKQNYTIDPSVQGNITFKTIVPLRPSDMIPTLQILLAQDNAVLVRSDGVYRVMQANQASNSPIIAGDSSLGGAVIVPLQFAQAGPLAATLQPYVASTGKIAAVDNQNALIVQGDPASREALIALIKAFDIDQLSGQSYELFPVTSGDASDFASAFNAALVKSNLSGAQGQITVVPLERMSAVLVIAHTQNLLADAQRVYAVLNEAERNTIRSWHIYYLQNSRANDAAYLLQQAFTPDDVSSQPTAEATGQLSSAFSNQSTPGTSSGNSGVGGLLGSSVTVEATPGAPESENDGYPTTSENQGETSGASALLGPLSESSATSVTNSVRIVADTENNALLIYATPAEDDRIDAMLDQLDVYPVEVKIDATIAEVDLNSALQYGTQFFFKSGGINEVLSEGTTNALTTNFPGFVLSGHNSDAAPLAISLLQSVTKVNVLASPELMVMDGQTASLQAGDLVPYLSQTSQSTLAAGSPVINSIEYRETGVILQIKPRVGSNGMVMLDVSQEVSGVESEVSTQGIDSPTFSERAVTSRIAVLDGDTVGLAGLISDSDSHGNQGIPYLKNIPLLGDLFGSQDNQRTRKELLVLITPHVIRNQSSAADLTADMLRELPNAADVPSALSVLPASEASDPDAALRSELSR